MTKPITDSEYRFVLRFFNESTAVVTNMNPTFAATAVRKGLGVRLAKASYRLSRQGRQVLRRLERGTQIVLQPRTTPKARYGNVVRG